MSDRITVVRTPDGWRRAEEAAADGAARVELPELGLAVEVPPQTERVTLVRDDLPLPWPTSAVVLVLAALLGVVLPATEPKALRKDAGAAVDQGPHWVIWPEDHTDRVQLDGRRASLVNPDGAGLRDGVTACFEAGPPKPGVMPISATWSSTSTNPEGLARVFGKVVVPGRMPLITTMATTHDSSPESTGKALLDVPDDAIAVQTCGSVGGPSMQLWLQIPD